MPAIFQVLCLGTRDTDSKGNLTLPSRSLHSNNVVDLFSFLKIDLSTDLGSCKIILWNIYEVEDSVLHFFNHLCTWLCTGWYLEHLFSSLFLILKSCIITKLFFNFKFVLWPQRRGIREHHPLTFVEVAICGQEYTGTSFYHLCEFLSESIYSLEFSKL